MYYDKVVEVADNAATNNTVATGPGAPATFAPTDVAAHNTEAGDAKLASYTSVFGPASSAYTTFTSDAGTVQVDAVGLEEGKDSSTISPDA